MHANRRTLIRGPISRSDAHRLGKSFAQQRGQLTREMGEKIFSGHIEKGSN